MSDIFYNFQQNDQSLSDIGSHMGDIQAVQDEIKNFFNVLTSTDAYQGLGSEALRAAQTRVSQMFGDEVDQFYKTHSNAGAQQENVQNVDRQAAQAF